MKLTISDTIVSLIIVTHNDEDIVQNRLSEIKKVLSKLRTNYEILVVDNNSSDTTVEKVKNLKVVMRYTKILVLSKRHNTEIALTAGLDSCVGDHAILFNIYTDPVATIQKIVDILQSGIDVVVAKPKLNLLNYGIFGKTLLWLVGKLSKHGDFLRQNYLTGLNRKVINSMIRTRRKSRNFSYINTLIGFKKENLIYRPLKKYKYKLEKETFLELLTQTLDTVISNSFRPIRIVSLAGMVFSALFLVYVLIIVILVLVFGMRHLAPQGWITVSTVLGTMFFLLFSLLGIISEYMIRILDESRDEPFYFVSEEINQSALLPKKKRSLNIV